MTFTKTPPTAPGFFAWQPMPGTYIHATEVCADPDDGGALLDTCTGCTPAELGGEWCRLVPAEEVNLTAMEFWHLGLRDVPQANAWNRSRAKRVAEGTEGTP